MCILPFFHIYGMGPIMTCGLHVGAKLLVSAKFDPKAFVRDISEHKVRRLKIDLPGSVEGVWNQVQRERWKRKMPQPN